jgi:anti-sigma regulatory factor (Ser/Thr protein kinase)
MTIDANSAVSRRLQLHNTKSECERLYDFLAEGLAQLPVTAAFRHDLKLVAEELLANIINHGYDKDARRGIDIELVTDAHSVRLTFIDAGKAFNPLESKAPDVQDDLSEGGMGLLLVESLTDEQSYTRVGGRNVFTVTKHYNN